MENVKRNPLGWAEDGVLTGEVLKALDSTEGEDFVYTISVQAHGKYPTEAIDPGQTITAAGLEDRIGTVGFEYYLNQASCHRCVCGGSDPGADRKGGAHRPGTVRRPSSEL